MKTEEDLQTSVHPSKQKLAKATIVAALVAIVILVVAILPAILLVVFGGIWLSDKAGGGYKPEKIVSQAAVAK